MADSGKPGPGFVMVEGEEAADGRSELPAIDLSTFVLSLGTSALYHMGVAPDPSTGSPAPDKNLPLAKQTIDTLAMLEVKTRGNRDDEEDKLLSSLLYELRMRFVEAGQS